MDYKFCMDNNETIFIYIIIIIVKYKIIFALLS